VSDINAGGFCFRLCATCVILSVTLGIALAITHNPSLGSLALMLLVVSGVSFVAGVIIRIWE
jgi:hypothetical protein